MDPPKASDHAIDETAYLIQGGVMRRVLSRLNRSARRALLGDGVVNHRGRGIVNLIDVGSSIRKLPSPWFRNAAKISNLLAFEPREHRSKSPSTISIDAALWEVNEDCDSYVYQGKGGSGSSLFEQNVAYVSEHFDELRLRGRRGLADS